MAGFNFTKFLLATITAVEVIEEVAVEDTGLLLPTTDLQGVAMKDLDLDHTLQVSINDRLDFRNHYPNHECFFFVY